MTFSVSLMKLHGASNMMYVVVFYHFLDFFTYVLYLCRDFLSFFSKFVAIYVIFLQL